VLEPFQEVLSDGDPTNDAPSKTALLILYHLYFGSSGSICAAASFMACSGVFWPVKAS
jgi:hypothetical protein